MTSSYSNFPKQIGLSSLMAASLLIIVSTMLAIYVLLVRIELQTTLSFSDDTELEENGEGPQHSVTTTGKNSKSAMTTTNTNHEEGVLHQNGNKITPSFDEDAGVARRLHLPLYRRGALAGVVSIITLMAYLLLALSNANVVLCWIGMFVVLGLLLRQSIFEEVRRERMDRLAAIFSLVLLLAMSLNLAVYANRQHAQGDIYQGKARIVGYDYDSYKQNMDDKILRTDLEVEWGGWWGCPNLPDDFTCRGFVAGALCEAKEDDADQNENNNNNNGGVNRRENNRHLVKTVPLQLTSRRRIDENNQQEQQQDANQNDKAENNGAEQEDYATENEQLEQENEQLEQENQDLENENQELQDEVDAYKEAADEEAEVVDELYDEEANMYHFDDTVYQDDYWSSMSWSGVWGEYACEDLFTSDVDGQSYNLNDPPGSDDWPFVNIYGNCDTCDAYIVDFYSTEHFQSILSYKKAGLRYGILSGLAFIATGILMARHQANGNGKVSTDKGIELLPSSTAGALA
ncbi:hypothetical protein ACA910_018241 [Epithemia clementina (nom. ined.)]